MVFFILVPFLEVTVTVIQVCPAAGFPLLAKRNGARLAIINHEPTDQDGIADLVINAEIGAVLGAALTRL